MKVPHKAVAVTLSTLASVGVLATAAFAQAATPKIVGTIDREKVVNGYPKAQQFGEELKKSEEKVQKLVEDANKKYEEAKKASKSPAELEGLQRNLQSQIDGEVKKLQSTAQGLESQLENEIETAIKAEAASHKIDVVILKQAVLWGGVDITDGVLKRLATNPASKAAVTK